jgi:hypothetical protein
MYHASFRCESSVYSYLSILRKLLDFWGSLLFHRESVNAFLYKIFDIN